MRRRHAAIAAAAVITATAGAAAVATYQQPAAHVRAPASVPGTLAELPPTTAQLCVSGYTATIRPPASYTTALKIRQIAALHLKGTTADYEEDHRVPLSAGGHPTSELNLWPEPWPDARKKDVYELHYYEAMCAGRITLQQSQAVFLGDWWKAKPNP